jgi:hypothetical protein
MTGRVAVAFLILLVVVGVVAITATVRNYDHWAQRCAAAGGHVTEAHTLGGTSYLCLTADGRVLDVG